jgi:hypothetical protein
LEEKLGSSVQVNNKNLKTNKQWNILIEMQFCGIVPNPNCEEMTMNKVIKLFVNYAQ